MDKEDEIRLIAYNIWELEGCPDGKDCEHWFRAEVIWEQQRKPNITQLPAKTPAKQFTPNAPKPPIKRKKR